MKKPSASKRRLSFAEMSPNEIRAWVQATRTALQKKMQRERAYLDRRAAHGTSTPTDEAYAQDQLLEAELLVMLDEMEQSLDEVHH